MAQVIRGYEWLFEPPASPPPRWEPERGAAAFRRAISSDSAVVLVALVDGGLIGLCPAYDDIESVRFGRGVWVEDLAVHPAQRSRGTDKQLLDEANAAHQRLALPGSSSSRRNSGPTLIASTSMNCPTGAR